MKKITLLLLLIITCNASAVIARLSHGSTYCTNQYGANFKIDWKQNVVFLILAGADDYKIVKEVKNSQTDEVVFTARKDFGNEFLEFKLFSSSKGDFIRAWDKDNKVYSHNSVKLSCWEE